MMRRIVAITFLAVAAAAPVRAELREPLEKQFFDYFTAQCSVGLIEEAKSMNMDPSQAGVTEGIKTYCSCTSQAVVSHLDAEEIIAFAVDPTKDPAASKMKPFFEQCRGK